MQKFQIVLIFLFASFPVKSECQQQPTLYPGAVSRIKGEETGFMKREQYSMSAFLTKDSFDKVKAYYVSENTRPRHEQDDGKGGRSAFFSYVRRMPDDVGVTITERQGRSRVPAAIFSKLQGLAIQGVIPGSRVNEIKDKYSYLEKCYFIMERDDNGELVSVDDLIYRRYDRKLDPERSGEVDKEEIMQRAQQLMNQGRMQEGMELLKKMTEDQLAGIQLATSPEAADMWVECLDEIASSAYDVSISILL